MKRMILFFSAAAIATAASAQTPAKTPAPGFTAAKTSGAPRSTASGATGLILPAGVPRIPHGPMKAAFSLKYEDIKIGAGAPAEPNKLYKVFYSGYLGANGRPDDGRKFDSSDDHRRPVLDKDGKPAMGEDGKPKLGDPQPLEFPQGFGRLIPGFDEGFDGMRIGGKRRLFIPWQLAYGAHGRPGPDAAHPGIPPKSDLIFDVELVGVTDMSMQPGRPGMGARPMPGGMPPRPGTPLPPAGHPPATPPASGQTTPAGAAQPPAPANPGATPAQTATPPQQPAPPAPQPSAPAPPQPSAPPTPPPNSQPQSK